MSFKTKYGLKWDDRTADATIELWCYKNDRKPAQGGLGATQHMLNAISILWCRELPSGAKYVMSPWTLRRVKGWCEDIYKKGDKDHTTWLGPSSSGKSTDGAIIVLTDWLAAPDKTSTRVCSTTRTELEQRIWGEIVKYYNAYKGTLPGRFVASKMLITLDDSENPKNCIRGIAIHTGSATVAKNNIIGVHNVYNRLIVDECQDEKMGVATDSTVLSNMSSGCINFKFLGMGNPESRLDPLGIESEPEVGWNKVSTEDDSWTTKRGKTMYFDGLKSPAIDDPLAYPFLVNQGDIDKTRRDYGENSITWWSMRRGFMPPEGLTCTIITESMLDQYGMREDAIWLDGYELAAGCDPSFSAGGDSCIIYPGKYGKLKSGIFAIEPMEPIRIQFDITGKEPVTMSLAKDIVNNLKRLGVKPDSFGMDTTSQQFMLADLIEDHRYDYGRGIMRISFGESPSEFPISINDPALAKDRYVNRVTELWCNVERFARYGQIKGLKDVATCKQLTSRKLDHKQTHKDKIESKRDFKSRYKGRSPDEADALTCLIAVIKERKGLFPGSDEIKKWNQKQNTFGFKRVQDYDLDAKANYAKDSLRLKYEARHLDTINI